MEFDTLSYTKRAMASGYNAKQAEFHANEMSKIVSETLVSKHFLRQELSELESRMQSLQLKIAGTTIAFITTVITALSTITHFIGN